MMTPRLLFSVILASTAASKHVKDGRHFYDNHEVIDSRKYLENVYNYYSSDDKSRLNYTRWFFSPYEELAVDRPPPTYIFQNRARSKLFSKSPEIYNNLKGVSVDFYNKDDDILDPYSHLHAREEALVSENPLQVSPDAMFLNIRNVFSQSKLARTNEKIGTFLYRKLGRAGLVLYLQTFHYTSTSGTSEAGVNIVGVLPGARWGTAEDRPLVVATYWDVQGSQAEDYGSGLAVMIETVRILMLDSSYKPEHSTIFVAFDKRHDGSVGSRRFITHFLEPHVRRKYKCKIQGVFNLESVIKFSSANNSQSFPVSYYEKNPTVSYRIMSQGAKGDFLAALHRGSGAEMYLSETFRSYLHRRGHKQATFTFPNMARDHRFIQNLETYSDLWNNDVGRFWFTHESRKIPVVSLTDTGAYRISAGLGGLDSTNSVPDSMFALGSVTEALVLTVRHLTRGVTHASQTQQPWGLRQQESGSTNKNTDNASLYKLFSKFVVNFSKWQRRIEEKLSDIELSHQALNNGNRINVIQDQHLQRTNGTTEDVPYYVIIGDKPTNLEKLNDIIKNYYQNKKEEQSSEGPQNSPMVIKLVS